MPTPPSANVALLFPGLDALFNTNNLKQWLGYTFIKKKLDFASQCLSHLSGKKEDLFQFVTDHRRIHIVDFDRTLIVLTTLQVAIAERIQMDHHWDIAQGCSHGDLARNVICGVTSFEDAIDILWSFSQLRHICPEGYTANVRTSKGTPLNKCTADSSCRVSLLKPIGLIKTSAHSMLFYFYGYPTTPC